MDQALFHLINEQWTHPALDLFMAAISEPDIWKPLFVLLGLYALIFCGFKGRAFVLVVLVTLLISDRLVQTIKSAVNRPRPKQVQTVRLVQLQKASPAFLTLFTKPKVRYSKPEDRSKSGASFPSGHVTNNICFAVCCTLFFRRWGWLYFFVAAEIGYSRIYLGAHWPSDVIGTVFMAAGATLLMVAGLELLWRWAGKRWLPEVFARYPHLIESGDAS